MSITIEPGYEHAEEIKELFQEYTDMLCENDSIFKEYLKLQKYSDELNDLTKKYGHPDGRLYIVHEDKYPVGCVALRKINDESCELKRLYIKQEYRNRGIAEKLVRIIINDAREIGYKYILLDTLPFLTSAINLYKKLGFYETEKFNFINSPMKDALYLRYDL